MAGHAVPADVEDAVACLVTAFAEDPITGFLLQTGPHHRERVTRFFSLLMRARIVLKMPVLVTRGPPGIHGAAMGYVTAVPTWPSDLTEEWDRFEKAAPGLTERMATYDEITAKSKPDGKTVECPVPRARRLCTDWPRKTRERNAVVHVPPSPATR